MAALLDPPFCLAGSAKQKQQALEKRNQVKKKEDHISICVDAEAPQHPRSQEHIQQFQVQPEVEDNGGRPDDHLRDEVWHIYQESLLLSESIPDGATRAECARQCKQFAHDLQALLPPSRNSYEAARGANKNDQSTLIKIVCDNRSSKDLGDKVHQEFQRILQLDNTALKQATRNAEFSKGLVDGLVKLIDISFGNEVAAFLEQYDDRFIKAPSSTYRDCRKVAKEKTGIFHLIKSLLTNMQNVCVKGSGGLNGPEESPLWRDALVREDEEISDDQVPVYPCVVPFPYITSVAFLTAMVKASDKNGKTNLFNNRISQAVVQYFWDTQAWWWFLLDFVLHIAQLLVLVVSAVLYIYSFEEGTSSPTPEGEEIGTRTVDATSPQFVVSVVATVIVFGILVYQVLATTFRHASSLSFAFVFIMICHIFVACTCLSVWVKIDGKDEWPRIFLSIAIMLKCYWTLYYLQIMSSVGPFLLRMKQILREMGVFVMVAILFITSASGFGLFIISFRAGDGAGHFQKNGPAEALHLSSSMLYFGNYELDFSGENEVFKKIFVLINLLVVLFFVQVIVSLMVKVLESGEASLQGQRSLSVARVIMLQERGRMYWRGFCSWLGRCCGCECYGRLDVRQTMEPVYLHVLTTLVQKANNNNYYSNNNNKNNNSSSSNNNKQQQQQQQHQQQLLQQQQQLLQRQPIDEESNA